MSFEEYLETEIARTNERIEAMLFSDDPQMDEVMKWVVAEKGKQLRSRILIAAANLKSSHPDVTEFAAMLEILHTATLVHDDVIDDSPMRRGRESVYKRFGPKLAVYAGDYMIFSVFSKTKVSPSLAHKRMYRALESVCRGELGQNASVSDLNITEKRYIDNIRGKTAALFRLACELGARASKMPEKQVEKICQYGECFGMMFQVYDDLLDFGFGENRIGKPVNVDIVDGVYTLPLIYSMQDENTKDDIVSLIGEVRRAGVSKEIHERLRRIIVDSGALSRCKEIASHYYKTARDGIDVFSSGRSYDYLIKMLDKLNVRICSFNRK